MGHYSEYYEMEAEKRAIAKRKRDVENLKKFQAFRQDFLYNNYGVPQYIQDRIDECIRYYRSELFAGIAEG